MSWIIRFRGTETNTDDFLLEELRAVETTSGVPWSILNPYRELKVAEAMLAVILVRTGIPDNQVIKEMATLTLGDIKNAFEFVPDEKVEGETDSDEDDADPLENVAPISQSYSAGASSVTTGRRKKLANSG